MPSLEATINTATDRIVESMQKHTEALSRCADAIYNYCDHQDHQQRRRRLKKARRELEHVVCLMRTGWMDRMRDHVDRIALQYRVEVHDLITAMQQCHDANTDDPASS